MGEVVQADAVLEGPGIHAQIDANEQDAEVEDTLSAVKLSIWVLGAGVAFPWNAFISAPVFFENFHDFTEPNATLSHEDEHLWSEILLFFTIAFSVMNLIGQGFVVWLGHPKPGSTPITNRIVPSMFAMFVIMVSIPALSFSHAAQMAAFGILVFMSAFCGFCTAFLQGTLFGLGALFPQEYQQLVMIGNSSSGLIVTCIRIITKAYGGSRRISGSIYCFAASAWMLLCIACFYIMRSKAFARHYVPEFMMIWLNGSRETVAEGSAFLDDPNALGRHQNEFLSTKPISYEGGSSIPRRLSTRYGTNISVPSASMMSTASNPGCWRRIDKEIGRHLQHRAASPMDHSDVPVTPTESAVDPADDVGLLSHEGALEFDRDLIGTPTAPTGDASNDASNDFIHPAEGESPNVSFKAETRPSGSGYRSGMRAAVSPLPQVRSGRYVGVRRPSFADGHDTTVSDAVLNPPGENEFLAPHRSNTFLSSRGDSGTHSRNNTGLTDKEFQSRVRRTRDGVINDDFRQWADNKLAAEGETPAHSSLQIIWEIRQMAFTVWFCFTLSLSLFPGVVARIPSTLSDGWFTVWLIFLFNLFDSIGRIAPRFYSLPPQGVFVLGFARVVFAPFLILCAIDDNPKELAAALLVSGMALTNGYVGALSVMYAPQRDVLTRGDKQLAGTIMSFCLLLGLTCGSFLGLAICNYIPERLDDASGSLPPP
eukprot:TRINITY_DN12285_c0_g1_i1.p1 TRINITY_DN12285_c0_g1~~TRINITY_DN12285_c0_g1_i1.p1  ORF type:complete len:709 (+),score=144.56 TRINITY_DN12285_c0_g1_i1:142-2268(+)